uniref:EGF-like domain-containing protein n=1 Tax=Neogobius melanostomus TaxID=47308 RepID=A0A8C6SZA7_9GOBI
ARWELAESLLQDVFWVVRSEVFKPCVEDKDLAFCLNEGECSIIETVAGVHRHCRCKEGYHGLRCDQFVPKTDAILSDPRFIKWTYHKWH